MFNYGTWRSFPWKRIRLWKASCYMWFVFDVKFSESILTKALLLIMASQPTTPLAYPLQNFFFLIRPLLREINGQYALIRPYFWGGYVRVCVCVFMLPSGLLALSRRQQLTCSPAALSVSFICPSSGTCWDHGVIQEQHLSKVTRIRFWDRDSQRLKMKIWRGPAKKPRRGETNGGQSSCAARKETQFSPLSRLMRIFCVRCDLLVSDPWEGHDSSVRVLQGLMRQETRQELI